MRNRIITTIIAAAIAVTSFTAAPVQAADRGEIARFVLGAGALAVIANELSKNNGHTVTRHNNSYNQPRYNNHYQKPHYNNTYQQPRHNNVYKPKPNRKVVPSACLRVNNSGYGPRRYFGQHCLKNNMHNANRLPGGCTAKIQTNRGPAYVYAARCLRNNGWVMG
jgi:hypothetical protein